MKPEYIFSLVFIMALFSSMAWIVSYLTGTDFLLAAGICLVLLLTLLLTGLLVYYVRHMMKKTKSQKPGDVMAYRLKPWFLTSIVLISVLGLTLNWLAQNHYEIFQILRLI